MVKRIKQHSYNQAGFTLLEVMIALAIFSFFLTSAIFSLSYNVSSSILLKEDLNLHNLAEMKMNEVMIGRKEFTNATENDVDSGEFDIDGFENYKYEVKITRTEFPDLAQILGNQVEGEEDNTSDPVQKILFDKLKRNIEEMIWQVSVTVTNTQTDYSYELKGWINKTNPKLDVNFTF